MCSSEYAVTRGMPQCEWLDCTTSDSVVESFPVGQIRESRTRIDYPERLEFSENVLKMKQNSFCQRTLSLTAIIIGLK